MASLRQWSRCCSMKAASPLDLRSSNRSALNSRSGLAGRLAQRVQSSRPVSAVLIAIELLLFECHPRSIIPVALASATAAGVRAAFDGMHPVFAMPDLSQPGAGALSIYIAIGAMIGVFSVLVTRIIYWV